MTRFLLAAFCVTLVIPAFGDDTPGDTGSKADPPSIPAQRLATRLQRVLPESPEGWTATVNAKSEVVIVRREPVGWVTDAPNGPGFVDRDAADAALRRTLDQRRYRITLRLGPKLTREEFDELARQNAVRQQTRDALFANVRDIGHKFDQFVPSTPEEKRRVAEYEAAVAELDPHDLPQMFTEEHAVFAYASWTPFESVWHDDTRHECDQVRASIERYLGVYDAVEARDGVRLRFRD